jgi:mycothiol S-conjugate amidase
MTLLAVHGHPDDETVHAGGTLARYAAEGVRVVCVVCTRGELGRIADPVLATPENQANLGELRLAEMQRALALLGAVEWRWLGFRDSGTDGSPSNADPDAFCAQDPDEIAGRVAGLVRELRPQVIITHNEHGDDGHPDHVAAARAARAAYERAGEPDAWPEQLVHGLAPWTASKLYERRAQLARGEKIRRLVGEAGLIGALPTIIRAVLRWRPRHERMRQVAAVGLRPASTRVDVRPWIETRDRAIREFRTQVAPDSTLIALSPEEQRRLTPTEDYTLLHARVDTTIPEDDLFAGLRHTQQDSPSMAGAASEQY